MTSTVNYANAISFFTRTLQTYEQRLLCRQVRQQNIIFSLSARNPSHRCFITKGEAIQDNYTIELRDSGHGVFQCVLLSPVTLNRTL